MINSTETAFRPNHRTRVFALIAFMVLCLIISAAGGAVTATSVNDWYPALQKPFFNPPNWLFGPAWSLIYFLIAFSGWRVWLKRGIDGAKGAFAVYAVQLTLNLLWSFLFFGAQSPLLGLIDIVPLLILIIINCAMFWRIDQLAGMLLVPYALWVGFATMLNGAIYFLNP
ncbi:TspO/MBR family protein [Thalassospira xianhensis]|uniref:TspO n=1 Tax=Thalassospira xianhensis MCCC 1A02616 TaxID=1177929 RepID=A0A367UEN2_9PROT|nr:TspO/MBR family protein [Thalassospira xianhensis]RCK06678.1 TspO [Thalassospira xianhensis MCCC 1A02616]UKV15716.1 tryptophan-rich sensory protein [Thalassospiraceae bacterium SW-3-3]